MAIVSAAAAADTVNALAIGMVLLGVGIVWTRSTRQAIVLVSLQSLLLGGEGLVVAMHTGKEHLYVGAALILVVKATALPMLIGALVNRARANGNMPFAVARGLAVAAAVAVALMTIEGFSGEPFRTPLGATRALPSALAIMLLGLQIMMIRHHVIAQVAGFLVLENGMALAGLTAMYGMPLVIEAGIMLDLLLAVIVAFVYSRRIHEAHGDLVTKVLRELRG